MTLTRLHGAILRIDLFLCVVASTLMLFLLSCSSAPHSPAQREEVSTPRYLAYFGTYTRGDSKGIYVYRFAPSSGTLTEIGLAAEASNPSFLAVHPNHRNLYAVGEDSEGEGSVSAYEIESQTGRLELLNQVSSKGSGPCHANVDATGKMLVVANYGAGSTVSFPIRRDGTLAEAASVIQHTGSSVNERRQKGPHAHSVNFSPDNRFVVSADLGTDRLLVYRADPERAILVPNDPPSTRVEPGGGPRHFSFHPSGRYGYSINEMGNTITVFSYDAVRGSLSEIQMISTLPGDYEGVSHTAEIRVHPSGKFLYGSNRGHDSIAVFSINPSNGELTPVERVSTRGETPRNFNLDPTGRYLIAENQATDNVVIFEIDPTTGQLTFTGRTLEIPSPVCLRFVPQ